MTAQQQQAAAHRLLVLAVDDYDLPCRADPDRWQSTDPEQQEAAAWGCLRCPLLLPCGRYATTWQEPDGVWGGTTPADRGVGEGPVVPKK